MAVPEKFTEAFEPLHQAAAAATGLDDFGPPTYHEGLHQLLTALDQDGRVAGPRREALFGMLTGVLVRRLYTQEGWRRNPGYRDVRIERPLVITGIPRTGTTALHKLLALDPQFQGVERWLAITPMPRPPRQNWSQKAEFNACVAGLEEFLAAMPGFADAHEMTADSVDECLEVLQQDFVSNTFPSQLAVPAYLHWWREESETTSYQRYADVLRLIGLDDQDRRWLLKNPGHIWGIDDLLALFPDALVVQTHRDPAKAMPSVCRVLEMPQSMYLGENVRPEEIGPPEVDKWRSAVDRTERARRRHPDNFHDVRHADFRADPIATIDSVYSKLGLSLPADVETTMRTWLYEQPEERRRGADADPARYGLSAAALRERFADYITTYAL
ncbi:sulfotransferase family protein [Mycobacterium seoulense]|uniref:sulfotransferase family protein n=1 Tax=Mycobacterium seoulense TaxID=386911 RepID=UPI003CF245CB